jgi:hypothetical protein
VPLIYRLVVLWTQITTGLGVLAILCYSPLFHYSTYQYVTAAIIIFVSTNVLEGTNTSFGSDNHSVLCYFKACFLLLKRRAILVPFSKSLGFSFGLVDLYIIKTGTYELVMLHRSEHVTVVKGHVTTVVQRSVQLWPPLHRSRNTCPSFGGWDDHCCRQSGSCESCQLHDVSHLLHRGVHYCVHMGWLLLPVLSTCFR